MDSVQEHTDADLLTSLYKGDRKAFEAIYHKYVSGLYRYAQKNISRKEDCEEIIQETFESLWARHETLRIQTSLRGYLLGVVRYKIIHHIRTNASKRKYFEHFLHFEAVYQQNDEGAQELFAVQSPLDRAIGDLPNRCRMAVQLRLTEELSNREIASRMSITTRCVEGYMFRAFNHIRSVWPQYSGQE